MDVVVVVVNAFLLIRLRTFIFLRLLVPPFRSVLFCALLPLLLPLAYSLSYAQSVKHANIHTQNAREPGLIHAPRELCGLILRPSSPDILAGMVVVVAHTGRNGCMSSTRRLSFVRSFHNYISHSTSIIAASLARGS